MEYTTNREISSKGISFEAVVIVITKADMY